MSYMWSPALHWARAHQFFFWKFLKNSRNFNKFLMGVPKWRITYIKLKHSIFFFKSLKNTVDQFISKIKKNISYKRKVDDIYYQNLFQLFCIEINVFKNHISFFVKVEVFYLFFGVITLEKFWCGNRLVVR